MNYIAQQMYKVCLSNYEIIFGSKLKSLNQYNPHKGFEAFKKSKFFKTGDSDRFEELFPQYLFYGDVKRLTILIQNTETDLNNIKSESKTNDNYKTYCKKFLEFLKRIIASNNPKHEKVLIQVVSKYQIDGISELVTIMGGVDEFLQKALENSYFFDPDLVKDRSEKIVAMYNQNEPIPARWQGERKSGIKDQCDYPKCDIDTNGNSKVREVIASLTGYTVSQGKQSTFMNYKISHIWGSAQNPRYFTNLWNIVLIPAWVNDLLDKSTAEQGSTASKVLNTYQAICLKYYKINSLKLNRIGLFPTPGVNIQADVVEGTYSFNSIERKQDNGYGAITTQSCTI